MKEVVNDFIKSKWPGSYVCVNYTDIQSNGIIITIFVNHDGVKPYNTDMSIDFMDPLFFDKLVAFVDERSKKWHGVRSNVIAFIKSKWPDVDIYYDDDSVIVRLFGTLFTLSLDDNGVWVFGKILVAYYRDELLFDKLESCVNERLNSSLRMS